ncbi:MAG: hypothetical protein AB1567_11030 [bacterium]
MKNKIQTHKAKILKASNSSFPILFATSFLCQLKDLTSSQLSSLLIKINELKTDNILDNPRELIMLASKRCGLCEQSRWLTDKNIHHAKEKATQWLQNNIFVLFDLMESKCFLFKEIKRYLILLQPRY